MEHLKVLLADERFSAYVHRSDFDFQVTGYSVPVIGQPVAAWKVQPVTAYRKHHGIHPDEFSAYLEQSPRGAIFVAWRGDSAVGHVVVSAHWNHFAHIDELAVDAASRGQGVARALLDVARFWATRQQLAGVMLETQNNNLGACRLYERCGFELAGIDHLRYRGLDPASAEVAMFWYLLFPGRREQGGSSLGDDLQ